MRQRHVSHLLTRYVHGQLGPRGSARVINHVATCTRCRAALAREEQVARELQAELPVMGRRGLPSPDSLWAGVWREIASPSRSRRLAAMWLPGVTLVLALVLALVVVLPLLADEGVRVEAALQQARPISTLSPTPGVTETGEAQQAAVIRVLPQATVALAYPVGASPVPMPAVTVSPEVVRGAAWR